MQIHVLIIDPQNDFCNPNGSLYVPGADEDMNRLSDLIDRVGSKIEDIHVTMDSHHWLDIAHPGFWKNSSGQHPNPFTLITYADFAAGKWSPTIPGKEMRDYIAHYLQELESNGRYPHTIWPVHCLIGSEGYSIHSKLFKSLTKWESENLGMVNKVTKGSNFKTEHFSAIKAEVPCPEDPSTHINTDLITTLEEADQIVIAGEALSHCLANTVKDIADNFSDPSIVKKMILLEDCTSPVPDPPNMDIFTVATNNFLADLKSRGMRVMKSTDYLR